MIYKKNDARKNIFTFFFVMCEKIANFAAKFVMFDE